MVRWQWSETLFPTAAFLATILAASAVTPQAGEAQERATFSVAGGIAGGAATELGASAMVAYTRPLPISRLALRFDLTHYEWRRSSSDGRVSMGTANLEYQVPMGPISSYALVGVGGYVGSGSGTFFGWNGGLGLRANRWRVKPFVEARYHRSPLSREIIPLVIGVSF